MKMKKKVMGMDMEDNKRSAKVNKKENIMIQI